MGTHKTSRSSTFPWGGAAVACEEPGGVERSVMTEGCKWDVVWGGGRQAAWLSGDMTDEEEGGKLVFL